MSEERAIGAPTALAEMPPARRQERQGIVFGLVASLIWGGYIAVTHQGMSAGLTSWDLAFLRFAVAGIVLLPWWLSHAPLTLAGIGLMRGIVLALLAGPLFVLVGASGFLFAPLAHSAVIQLGMVTLMGILLARIFNAERQTGRRALGTAFIVAGLAVTAGPSLLLASSQAWKGDMLFALAGTMWAIFTVLQRRWKVDALAATATVSVVSALIYVPLYLFWKGGGRLLEVSPLLLLQQAVMLGVLAGGVALFAFGRAVQLLGAARASIFPALAPAVAILLGIPLSGTVPTPWQLAGLVTLSIGLLLGVQSPRKSVQLSAGRS
ncbi:MAG: DMT family transporter [Pseudomonadota bacterium]